MRRSIGAIVIPPATHSETINAKGLKGARKAGALVEEFGGFAP